jgi:hypothetical protein
MSCHSLTRRTYPCELAPGRHYSRAIRTAVAVGAGGQCRDRPLLHLDALIHVVDTDTTESEGLTEQLTDLQLEHGT